MTLSQFRASEPVSQFPCLKNGVQSSKLSPVLFSSASVGETGRATGMTRTTRGVE